MKTAILMSAYFNIAVFPYIHKDWHGCLYWQPLWFIPIENCSLNHLRSILYLVASSKFGIVWSGFR